jgi:hypothetical protein
MRLRELVAIELAKDGLKIPAGWTVTFTPDGTLCVHDPADDEGNGHGRVRAGIRIEGADHAIDENLVRPMTIQARSALRRGRTIVERRNPPSEFCHARGWSVMMHPLAAAMCRAEGMTGDHVPLRTIRPDHVGYPHPRHRITFATATTQDLLTVTLDTFMGAGGVEVQAYLDSKPGRTTLAVATTLPDTALTALHGQTLSTLIDARCGDARIDAALAEVTIARIEIGTGAPNPVLSSVVPHVLVTTAPAVWLPWGEPPADVARLVALSPERC